jgi:pimeloyl-ACP methyl ester carboxylesterase
MGWTSNIEAMWEEPGLARFLSRLAAVSRLIIFDKRGTGLSDRVSTDFPTFETRMDDTRAVMDSWQLFAVGRGGGEGR